jgi:hypothetical protein
MSTDDSLAKWFERFEKVGMRADAIAHQRQQKYGRDNIGFLGGRGLIPRILDKVMRLKCAIWDNVESHDAEEKVVDAALDLRNYAQFLVMVLENTWYEKE